MSMIEGTAQAQGNGNPTTRSMKGLDVIHPGAAGLDLHKEVILACAPMGAGDTRHPVKEFGTYTGQLLELARWLKAHGVTTVAMEAAGPFVAGKGAGHSSGARPGRTRERPGAPAS